jgi:hypothetical protein
LSAARSVVQYAGEEAGRQAGGQAWYDGYMATSKVLKFFKDRHDVNVRELEAVLEQAMIFQGGGWLKSEDVATRYSRTGLAAAPTGPGGRASALR